MPLTNDQKSAIQIGYSQWLKNNNYKARWSQREMIAIIARAIASVESDAEGHRIEDFKNHVSIVEAGTGTGKTVAYAIPAISLALELGKTLIISTATINLQEQLIAKDLPNIASHSGLTFEYSIAKGRQRYLCTNKLTLRLQDSKRKKSDESLFPDEESILSQEAVSRLNLIYQQFQHSTWNGDRDSLVDDIPNDEWPLIAADRATCSGKKCAHYKGCALFTARDQMRHADVIVANHDLVLADLSAGGGTILPAPENAIYIFDEAHHLPEKSRNHHALNLSITSEKRGLLKGRRLLETIATTKNAPIEFNQVKSKIIRIDEGLQASLDIVGHEIDGLLSTNNSDHFKRDHGQEYRFKHGVIPGELKEILFDLTNCYKLKQVQLQAGHNLILDLLDKKQIIDSHLWEAHATALGQLVHIHENGIKLLEDFIRQDVSGVPSARWLSRSEYTESKLHSLPLSAASILKKILWEKCYATILTSATLASLGSFASFITTIGWGQAEYAYRIAGQLNFSQAIFHVPKMASDPSSSDEHTEEIIRIIPELTCPNAGTLILFSSKKQMEAVYHELSSRLSGHLLMQGKYSKKNLVNKHKEYIDAGEASIIFGLASFAEGVDLPGDYCKQVIIAKLPFAAPDSPADQAMAEWIDTNGGHAFADMTLPAAAVRLMQACGRLLRNESDSGRVSLLDRRILTKSYGKALLNSLPPFNLDLNL